MIRRLFVYLLFVVTLCAIPAQSKGPPLVIQGDTVTLLKSLPAKVVAPPGYDLYDWSYPEAVKADADGNTLTLTAAPKSNFKVRVRMTKIDFDKKKVERDTAEVEVNYGGVDPGPKPPPPVPPDDPLVKSLKDAYNSETSPDKGKHIEALASLFSQAAKMDLSPIKTTAELYQKLTAASRALLPVEALPAVRKITGDQMKTVLGDVTSELTAEQRQRVLSLFARLGNALTEVTK